MLSNDSDQNLNSTLLPLPSQSARLGIPKTTIIYFLVHLLPLCGSKECSVHLHLLLKRRGGRKRNGVALCDAADIWS